MIKPTLYCRSLVNRFFRLVDGAYDEFLNNEEPYNQPGEPKDPLFDRNWLRFISRTENTADKFLAEMGLNEDEIYNLNHDFNMSFDDSEFEKAIEKNSNLYNIHIAEMVCAVYKMIKGLSDRYVYVDRDEFAEKKKPIQQWLDSYKERQPEWRKTSFKINKDLSIDADGDVDIDEEDLVDGKLPVKFNKVKGSFYSNSIGLQSLQGCPEVVEESFYCGDNNLTSLEGGPKVVKKDYDCSNNKLTSLEGAPDGEMFEFKCNCNQLTILTGAPRVVHNFLCNHNKLTSLIGAPDVVKFKFECRFNEIVSLEGCPKQIGDLHDLSGECTDNDNYLEFYPQGTYEKCGFFIAGNNPNKWTSTQLKKVCPKFYAKVDCRRAGGDEVKKEDTDKKFYISCSYEYNTTCDDYSTLWMTYTCDHKSIRKRVRIRHSCFYGLWCREMYVWVFLKERVGEILDKKNPMTMKELKHLIKTTNHFDSEHWDENMRNYVWYWGYTGKNYEKLEEMYKNHIGSDRNIVTTIPRVMVTRKAISAELIQDIYYNESGSYLDREMCEKMNKVVYRTSGKYKEKNIGLYKITVEESFKNKKDKIVTRTITRDLWALKGTDVAATWQKLFDRYVNENGDWWFPKDLTLEIYKQDIDSQFDRFYNICKEYKENLMKEYGCKIEVVEP